MVGSSISGPGIPAGTQIVALLSNATTAVLSQAATASGTISLTVTNPGYISLPPGDNGWFVNNNYGSQGWCVFELRSTVPHGLSAGQYVILYSNGNAIPLTNVGNWNPSGGTGSPIWVTGPYTIVWYPATAAASAPVSAAPETINSTTELYFSGGWTSSMQVPSVNHCVPYEYPAAMASQLPGSRPAMGEHPAHGLRRINRGDRTEDRRQHRPDQPSLRHRAR